MILKYLDKVLANLVLVVFILATVSILLPSNRACMEWIMSAFKGDYLVYNYSSRYFEEVHPGISFFLSFYIP